MKPRQANELRHEAALHRTQDRQLERKHTELHEHAAHYKGHVYRHPRLLPRNPRPPQLSRRPPTQQRQRTQQAQQPQGDIDNDIQDNERQRDDSERAVRQIALNMSMHDNDANLGGDERQPDARATHYKWLQARVAGGKPGPRHGDGLEHDSSPEVLLLRRASAQPGTVPAQDCAEALVRALHRSVGGDATRPANAAARAPAAAALHALELGTAFLRSGADPECFASLRQVRDALIAARSGEPATRAKTPPDEAQQDRNLLLPLVLLALGRPRTPGQLDATLARRANAAASVHAVAQGKCDEVRATRAKP